MKDNIKEVLKGLSLKRNQAMYEQQNRKEALYLKFPRLGEIDREMNLTGVQLAKAVLKSPSEHERIAGEVQDRLNKLASERESIFKLNGIPSDYLDVKYECNKCNDTGYLNNGEKCSCLMRELTRQTYKMSNLDKLLEKENFSTSDTELFSDEPFEGESLSPRKNMVNNLSIAQSFCFNFKKDNGENLLFYGNTGLGKTFLTNCIAKSILDKGYIVLYLTAFSLMDIVQSHRFSKEHPSKREDEYNLIFDCDLLIIDDLGSEMVNTFTNTELFNIINSRIIRDKKTIISTNLEPLEIAKIYTDRIFSRISKHFKKVKFYGYDLRWQPGKPNK